MSACLAMLTSLLMTARTLLSVPITKVARLLGRMLQPALDAELLGHGAIGVRQQRIVEGVGVGELLLLGHGVGADPQTLGPEAFELRLEVTEVTALPGAAHGHGGGIEEQDHGALGQELAQAPRGPGLVGELEVRHHVTGLHGRDASAAQ